MSRDQMYLPGNGKIRVAHLNYFVVRNIRKVNIGKNNLRKLFDCAITKEKLFFMLSNEYNRKKDKE